MKTTNNNYDISVEKAVLGSILIDPSSINKIKSILTTEDFFAVNTKIIYHTLLEMQIGGKPIDKLVLMSELKRKEKLETVGGSEQIALLETIVPSAINILDYAKTLKELSIKRMTNRITKAQDLKEIEKEIEKVKNMKNYLSPFCDEQTHIRTMFDEIDRNTKNKLLSFGHKEIDDVLLGIFPTSLVVIAAETGLGKSQFVGNLTHNALKNKKKVAYFDLENSAGDFYKRRLLTKNSNLSMIHLSIYEHYIQKSKEVGDAIADFEEETKGSKLYTYNNDKLPTIEDFTQTIEDLKRKEVDLIVIDHIHYFDSNNEKEVNYLGRLMRILKNTTNKYNIPIICVAHIRKRIGAKNSEIELDDLYGSSNIAKEANSVILFQRDNSVDGFNTKIKIAKNREGGNLKTFYGFFDNLKRDFTLIKSFDNNQQQNFKL